MKTLNDICYMLDIDISKVKFAKEISEIEEEEEEPIKVCFKDNVDLYPDYMRPFYPNVMCNMFGTTPEKEDEVRKEKLALREGATLLWWFNNDELLYATYEKNGERLHYLWNINFKLKPYAILNLFVKNKKKAEVM